MTGVASSTAPTDVRRSTATPLPAVERSGPGEARTERGDADQIAFFQAPRVPGLREQDGNRRRRRVAVAIDVVDHAIVAETESHRDELVDAKIGLVGNDHRDVFLGAADGGERFFDALGHARDRVAKDETAV